MTTRPQVERHTLPSGLTILVETLPYVRSVSLGYYLRSGSAVESEEHGGASHFLEHLVDGDYASNNHGWQWVAGSGAQASPFFRVFNPLTQGEKFDPHGDYVRRQHGGRESFAADDVGYRRGDQQRRAAREYGESV